MVFFVQLEHTPDPSNDHDADEGGHVGGDVHEVCGATDHEQEDGEVSACGLG